MDNLIKDKDEREVSQGLKLLAKTSFIVFIGVALSRVLGYAYRIIVARYYGAEVYGLFSLALMVSSWLIAFSGLGMAEGLVRFVSLYRGKKELKKIRYVFNFALSVSLVTSVIAGAGLYLLAGYVATEIFHNASLVLFLRVFSLLIPASVIASLFLTTIRAYERINLYSFIFNIAQNVFKVLFLVLFGWLGWEVLGIPLSYLIGMLSIFVISYISAKHIMPEIFGISKLGKRQKLEIRSEFLNYSIPLLFFAVVSVVLYWVDSFSIGYFKSAVEVGLYNAALPIAALLGVAPELFVQLFFPLINREYSNKKIHVIKELSKQVGKWILIFNLPAFILIVLFPGAALNILFGVQYLAAENALRILAISYLITSLLSVSQQLVLMAGKSKLVLMNIILAALLNAVLNSVFVPMEKIWFMDNSMGINGAAFATMISVVFLGGLFFFQTKRYLSIVPLRRKMLWVVLISIIPTLLLVYLKRFVEINAMSIILLACLFFVVYFLLMLLTRSFDKNDMMIIKTIFYKITNKK